VDPLEQAIEELKKELGEDVITTGSNAPRPEKAIIREAFDDFNERNPLAGGGMLVEPGFGGVRQGYKDKKPKVKEFTATSGPGTGSVFDDPAAIKIVKAELNKIKKQRNNKDLFEWSEKSDWYKNLRRRLNPNTKKGLNREFTNKLINQVVDEFFPGAYHGKNAVTNFRNDIVVKSFIQHLKSVGEFDGQEKFDPVLDQFTYKKDGKRKDKMHLYEDINRSWKQWIAGEFEVDGVDRAQLRKELKVRNINYNQITNWKASAAQARGVKKIAELKTLNILNNSKNKSVDEIKALFFKEHPGANFDLRVNELTQLKNTGVYASGATTERSIPTINKGDRAPWLKQAYGKQFAGNYSKTINAADQLAAAGETAKAERLYRAADKFFGPKGIIRKSAVGEAEHALARTFDFLNPNRQLAINSIVSGDLNQFKKNLFDVPVKNYFLEYNNPKTTSERRVQLKNLIEDRKKVMNAITGGQKKGIVAGDIVKFRYGKNSITATSNVPAVDTLFKQGKFNIDDFIERGNRYGEAFQTIAREANIVDKSGQLKITKPVLDEKQFTNVKSKIEQSVLNNIQSYSKLKECKIPAADGGRIGFQASTKCITDGLNEMKKNAAGGDKKAARQLISTAKTAATGSRLIKNILGPGAILGEAIFEGALIGNKVLGGKPLKQAWAESFLSYLDPRKYRGELDPLLLERDRMLEQSGYKDVLKAGFSAQDQLSAANEAVEKRNIASARDRLDQYLPAAADAREQAARANLSTKIISDEAFKDAVNLAQESIQGLEGNQRFKYGIASTPQGEGADRQRRQIADTAMKNLYTQYTDQELRDMLGQDKFNILSNQRITKRIIPSIATTTSGLDYLRSLTQEQEAKQRIADAGGVANLAGGGIAGLSGGIDKGPQRISMNPDSQGLSGLLKNDNKI
jgi:hypothetical protein